MIKIDKNTDGLIIVDVQYDFLPGGALGVPGSDVIIPIINKLIPKFKHVYTTQDWHPENHISFKPQGGIWPVHCVKETSGAQIHEDLNVANATHILKGTDSVKEAYSGFQGTDFVEILKSDGIKRIFIVGLTTDYCVKDTAIDALKYGFEAIVITDAIYPVNVKPNDGKDALNKMVDSGAVQIESGEISL